MLPRNAYSSDAEYLGALRDWFAGQALVTTAERSHHHGLQAIQVGSPMHPGLAAKAAYAFADAMLAQREVQP